jgi:hypothetical protein
MLARGNCAVSGPGPGRQQAVVLRRPHAPGPVLRGVRPDRHAAPRRGGPQGAPRALRQAGHRHPLRLAQAAEELEVNQPSETKYSGRESLALVHVAVHHKSRNDARTHTR